MAEAKRNDRLVDWWSLIHLVSGVALGILLGPWPALALLVAWEPLEIFVLSPLVHRTTGKRFGYEAFRNSASDIFFDAVGVATSLVFF